MKYCKSIFSFLILLLIAFLPLSFTTNQNNIVAEAPSQKKQ